MTRSGRAFALPVPEPRTAAIASSSSQSGPAQRQGSRLLPTPVAGNYGDGADIETWQARRDRQKKPGRNGDGIGTPLPAAIALLPTPLATDGAPERSPQVGGKRPSGAKRQAGLPEVIIHRLTDHGYRAAPGEPGQGRLLPTPDTGCSPNGHGRRGGRAGNGHQSGHGLDVAATALSAAPAPRAGQGTVAWGEYELAIRRWERLLGYPAPPPAEPGPSGRPRLSAGFAEWMMGLAPGFVTGVPGIPRTRQLKIIGNGVVPQQAAAALRLLIETATVPRMLPGAGTGSRAAA
jgi:DNA (cytosine-5)-methyltransferase 1